MKYIHHYFFLKFLTKKTRCILWAGKYGKQSLTIRITEVNISVSTTYISQSGINIFDHLCKKKAQLAASWHPSIHQIISVAGKYSLNYDFFPIIQLYGVLYTQWLFVSLKSKIVVTERQDMSRTICRLCLKLENDNLLALITELEFFDSEV